MSVNEMDFDNLYGSKYFAASDLDGETQRHKVSRVEQVELREKDGSTKRKLAMSFANVEKILVLNMTNANRLADAYGKNPQKWIGVSVDVYPEETSFGMGVRLRPLKVSSGAPMSTKTQASSVPDEETPF
jgi:hypothetical protein